MKQGKSSTRKNLITQHQKSIGAANDLIVALRSPLRQKILKLLLTKPNMQVNEIAKRTKLDKTMVSQHLGKLRKAKLVTFIRQGRFIIYSVNLMRLKTVLNRVEDLVA